MKTATKVALGVGGLVAVLAIMGAKKISNLSAIVGQLYGKFKRAYNVGISSGKLTATIDFEVVNPTNQPLDISLSVITLKKVLFYNRFGDFIGEALLNISSLSIPGNSSKIITGLPITVNITTALPEIISLLVGANETDIQTKLVFEGLGQTYTTGLNGINDCRCA